MKPVVLFDIDKTLIEGYSQQLFLNFTYRNGTISFWPYLKINAWFLLYKLGLLKNPKPIMEYAYEFAKNWSTHRLALLVDKFFKETLKPVIYKDALEIIEKHKKKGDAVILVSNSVEPIVKKIADELKLDYFLGTKLELVDNKYTGKIIGDIVYGEHKPSYVKKYLAAHKLTLNGSWCYSDHISDLPLFSLCENCVASNSSRELANYAKRRGWQIVDFKK